MKADWYMKHTTWAWQRIEYGVERYRLRGLCRSHMAHCRLLSRTAPYALPMLMVGRWEDEQ